MINSVSKFEPIKNNPFGIVSQRNSDSDYWLNNDYTKDNSYGVTLGNVTIMTPENARKTHNIRNIGLSIAGATLLTALGLVFLLKGGPKGLTKGFEKLRNYYERKLQKSKLAGVTSNPKYEYILGKINSIMGKIEIGNNLTTIKDYAFKRLMYGGKRNWKYTRKIHNGITKFFEKIGIKTVVKSYKNTSARFDKLQGLNDSILHRFASSSDLTRPITINGVTKTKAQWIEVAKSAGADILSIYKGNFSETKRTARYLKIKKFTKDLERTFDAQGPFWFLSKDTFKSFVAESKMLPKKLQMQQQIKGYRKSISHSTADLYHEADGRIIKIASALGVKDTEALQKLNKVRENFKKVAQNQNFVMDLDMIKDLDDLSVAVLKSADPRSANYKSLLSNLSELKSSYVDYKQGKFEDILSVYKELLPQSEFEEVQKLYSKTVKSLDKSITIESEDFINKSRDLAMGSAPTDILTVLGSFGTLAYYLGKSDNNQEKATISLKYGIPALAAVATSLYANARLFAGTKSFAFAALSGLVVGKIGDVVNNLMIAHLKKKGTYIPPKSGVNDKTELQTKAA